MVSNGEGGRETASRGCRNLAEALGNAQASTCGPGWDSFPIPPKPQDKTPCWVLIV